MGALTDLCGINGLIYLHPLFCSLQLSYKIDELRGLSEIEMCFGMAESVSLGRYSFSFLISSLLYFLWRQNG